MNEATSYDDRSRIRAQMRIVKKKTQTISEPKPEEPQPVPQEPEVEEPELDEPEVVTSFSQRFSRQSSSVTSTSVTSATLQRTLSQQLTSLKMTSHLPEPEAVQPEMAHTLDITSSYGTGPMDDDGRPLFGLGALRRRRKQDAGDDVDAEAETPQPIIIERSQTLDQLQKLHRQQQLQQQGFFFFFF